MQKPKNIYSETKVDKSLVTIYLQLIDMGEVIEVWRDRSTEQISVQASVSNKINEKTSVRIHFSQNAILNYTLSSR